MFAHVRKWSSRRVFVDSLFSRIGLSQTAASYASTGVAFAANVAAAGGAFASSPASLRVTANNIGNTSMPLVSGTRGQMGRQ